MPRTQSLKHGHGLVTQAKQEQDYPHPQPANKLLLRTAHPDASQPGLHPGKASIHYPDQRLLSYLLEGVRLEADVELQTVLIPHLTSLPPGYNSVRKEILRLHGKNWYEFFGGVPFWPIYCNGQGATPRKLEPDRWRRTTEGGGPRQPLFDDSGLPAWSINAASKAHHLPEHFLTDKRPAFLRWLAAKGLPRSPEQRHSDAALRSKWPRERKPTLSDVMRDLTVLKVAATALGQPLYVFGDDAADYFNQLALAPEEWWKLGIVFIQESEVLRTPAQHSDRSAGNRLFFVSERRLGFGTHPASNVAQRFSDAILHLFREDMDRAVAPFLRADTTSAYLAWREARSRIRLRNEPNAHVAHHRLYFAHMYTDDPIIGVVGVERAKRALRVWRQLTNDLHLILAIPEKRTLGVWARWLGAMLFATIGVVTIPKSKLLRAAVQLRAAVGGALDFAEYRSLVGVLEHFRCINHAPPHTMRALYHPHRVGSGEPNERVTPNPDTLKQLLFHESLISSPGGAHFSSAVRPTDIANEGKSNIVAAFADAATDSVPPGMGGYCHGMYWYLELSPLHIEWLHITSLELLATGFNAIAFATYLVGSWDVVLMSDALATPKVLVRKQARSDSMHAVLRALLADEVYAKVSERARVAHLNGDCNPMADAVSRGEWPRFHDLCAQIHLRATPVSLPLQCLAILDHALQTAIASGVPVRTSAYRPPEPFIPELYESLRVLTPTETFLNAERSCNSLSDGPYTVGAAFAARMRGHQSPRSHARFQRTGNTCPPPPAKLILTRPWRPLTTTITPTLDAANRVASAQLASQLSTSAITGRSPPQHLRQVAEALTATSEHGSAAATLKKDETAWKRWCEFAAVLDFDPVINAADATSSPDTLASLLASFLLYVHAHIPGRAGGAAKPSSSMAYPLAIMRVLKRWGVPVPPSRQLRSTLKGLMRSYVNENGKELTAPRRRQPFLFKMLQALCIRNNSSSEHDTRTGTTLLKVMWRSGHRLGEIVKTSEEVTYLLRSDVSYRIGGYVLADPTPQQLASMRSGDCAFLAPSRSKTDFAGVLYSPFPSVLPFNTHPTNAASALRDLELLFPCHGTARSASPLFATAEGEPYTRHKLDAWLKQQITVAYDAATAKVITWHSLRIGLACALRAAGCPDEVIQLICRWASPQSLTVYARLGMSTNAAWTDKAESANVDAIQTANIPTIDGSRAFAELHDTFTGHLGEPAALPPAPPQHPTLAARAAPSFVDRSGDARRESLENPRPPATVDDKRPTRIGVGDTLVVLRHVYPNEQCCELGGVGWRVRVLAHVSAWCWSTSSTLDPPTATDSALSGSRPLRFADLNLTTAVSANAVPHAL